MKEFTPMTQVLEPGSLGSARIDHYTVGKLDSMLSGIKGGALGYCREGTYARLLIGGHAVMSDTPMEYRSNYPAVVAARGDVLIAGLGLGMIIIPIARKAEVKNITVVEKNSDVISLVLPKLLGFLGEDGNKISVIEEDIMDYKPKRGVKFDCIYFDIWPDICTDNLTQIDKLHQRFKGRLKGERWMKSWMRDVLIQRKRSGH